MADRPKVIRTFSQDGQPARVNGVPNPRSVQVQFGRPVGPQTFARDKAKPFTNSSFGTRLMTRGDQRFPPRELPFNATRDIQ